MTPAPSQQVLADAAEWFALLRSGDVSEADVRRWRHWLAANPEHHRGWQMVERVEQQFNAACGDDPAQAEATLARTRQRRLDRRGMIKGMALLFGAGGLGWAGWGASPLPTVVAAWGASHRTGTGEVRELTLPDGSRLWLNTNTAINTRFNADGRRIDLITGEILLATAPDHRPLIVSTAQGQARPLGTRFTVRSDDDTTLVAVYQGKVAVTNGREGTRIVPAGRQTRFSDTAIEPPETADPAREAWHRGVLVADDIRLADLIDELSRYQHGYINVAPEVAGLRVFGGYSLTRPWHTLSLLEKVLPIRVSRPLPWWTEIRPAGTRAEKDEK
ncbi:MAG: DUF4880 domain-containing protein [Alcanivorax sp.]|nr:DUF4880 domain-containing protein [Alcanivorax sp.]